MAQDAPRQDDVLAAFRTEAAELIGALAGLSDEDFRRPTRCTPWTVAELVAHVATASGRLTAALAADPPGLATVSIVDYYRPDERFSAGTNEIRIRLAREQAAAATNGRALVVDLARAAADALALADTTPPDRTVLTRHGDAMTLHDFLVTRVVELALHGLDLSDALDREPWLTEPAATVVAALVLPASGTGVADALGWDRTTLIRKATGRAVLTDAEAGYLSTHGIHWLTFG
ncbi:MAG: maleylpyruvate isomerase N-terminal domain-containing protein [Actinocatenispora sp.]